MGEENPIWPYRMQTKPIQMVDEARAALQEVRGGLIELYGAVGADPTAPQEVARRYGINRNLTWKLSRVINAAGPFASLNHLPGQQGLELAIGAFENAGASREAVAHVRSAVQRFTEVVQAQPDRADAHHNLGVALREAGRLDEAVVQFAEVVRLRPGDDQARSNLRAAEAARR